MKDKGLYIGISNGPIIMKDLKKNDNSNFIFGTAGEGRKTYFDGFNSLEEKVIANGYKSMEEFYKSGRDKSTLLRKDQLEKNSILSQGNG